PPIVFSFADKTNDPSGVRARITSRILDVYAQFLCDEVATAVSANSRAGESSATLATGKVQLRTEMGRGAAGASSETSLSSESSLMRSVSPSAWARAKRKRK